MDLFSDASAENFNLMPRELAFKLTPEYDKYLSRSVQSAGLDHGPRIFTSLNLFPFFNNPGGDKSPKDLREEMVFVGVPLIPIDASNANQKDSVSICVAGATTISNTGPYRINAGQLVAWDIPTALADARGTRNNLLVKLPGTPARKALFMTVPVDGPGEAGVTPFNVEDLLAAVVALGNGTANKRKRRRNAADLDTVSKTYQKMLQDAASGGTDAQPAVLSFLKGFFLLLAQSHRRVIGIALSSAESGEQMDILLRGGGAF
jgi:hypothetical protein